MVAYEKFYFQYECIPVGCVQSAAVAVSPGGSASVHAGIPPLPGPGTPQTRHPQDQAPPWDQAPPLWTDRQTPVKI